MFLETRGTDEKEAGNQEDNKWLPNGGFES